MAKDKRQRSGLAIAVWVVLGVATLLAILPGADGLASLEIFPGNAAEDSGTLTFNIVQSSDIVDQAASEISWTTTGGTAVAADFGGALPTGMQTINAITAGAADVTYPISIALQPDLVVELDETFELTFTITGAATHQITAGAVTAMTINNDDFGEILVDDVTLAEGSGGGVTGFTFTISITHEVDVGTDIGYDTLGGTATDGSDFTGETGSFTVPANTAPGVVGTVTVNVGADTLVEAGEFFELEVSYQNPVRAISFPGGDNTGTGTITNDDTATITIGDYTEDEDAEPSQTAFQFLVTMDLEVDVGVTLEYETADGTALAADGDYVAISTTSLTVGVGPSFSQIVSVLVDNDAKTELGETFFLDFTLVTPLNRDVVFAGGDSRGTGTIVNDDPATISITDRTLFESSGGVPSFFSFTVTLDNEVDVPIDVEYQTVDGTAVDATDYVAIAATTQTMAGVAGETFEVVVEVNGDDEVELGESFLVSLVILDASGRDVTFNMGDSTGLGTITNDDQALLSFSDQSEDEDAGTISFVVTLSAAVDQPVDIDYSTTGGTATAPSDFTNTGTMTLNFAGTAGETQTLVVTLSIDTVVEANEIFYVDFSNLQAGGRNVAMAGADTRAQATVVNDDSAEFSVDSPSVVEPAGGATINLGFSVTLSAEVDVQASVEYILLDGTATSADNDFVYATATVTFPAGTTGSQLVNVVINGDDTVELDETFVMQLAGIAAQGRQIDFGAGSGAGTGTILNDALDAATVTINDPMADESDSIITFVVTLDLDVDVDVTLNYATADGTATVGDADYSAAAGTITFEAGSGPGASISIPIAIGSDTKVEADETVVLALSGLDAVGRDVTLGTASGTGTITNDDAAIITIFDSTVAEGADGDTVDLVFRVTLNRAVDVGVDVMYQTADGSATTADNDYAGPILNTLNFDGSAGQTLYVVITVNGDDIDENDETFDVDLVSVVAGGRDVTAPVPVGVGTITDDDTAGFDFALPPVLETGENAAAGDVVIFVALNSEPRLDVTVTASSSDSSEGQVLPAFAGVVFTAGDWDTMRTVTVVGVDDIEIGDGDIAYNLNVVASSSDPGYDLTESIGLINIDDDDVPPLTNLQAEVLTDQVTLTWDAPAGLWVNFQLPFGDDEVTDYLLFVDTGSGFGAGTALGSTDTTTVILSLTPETSYVFRIAPLYNLVAGIAVDIAVTTPGRCSNQEDGQVGTYDLALDLCACDSGYFSADPSIHLCDGKGSNMCFLGGNEVTFRLVRNEVSNGQLVIEVASRMRPGRTYSGIAFTNGLNCKFPGINWVKGFDSPSCEDRWTFTRAVTNLADCGAVVGTSETPPETSGRRMWSSDQGIGATADRASKPANGATAVVSRGGGGHAAESRAITWFTYTLEMVLTSSETVNGANVVSVSTLRVIQFVPAEFSVDLAALEVSSDHGLESLVVAQQYDFNSPPATPSTATLRLRTLLRWPYMVSGLTITGTPSAGISAVISPVGVFAGCTTTPDEGCEQDFDVIITPSAVCDIDGDYDIAVGLTCRDGTPSACVTSSSSIRIVEVDGEQICAVTVTDESDTVSASLTTYSDVAFTTEESTFFLGSTVYLEVQVSSSGFALTSTTLLSALVHDEFDVLPNAIPLDTELAMSTGFDNVRFSVYLSSNSFPGLGQGEVGVFIVSAIVAVEYDDGSRRRSLSAVDDTTVIPSGFLQLTYDVDIYNGLDGTGDGETPGVESGFSGVTVAVVLGSVAAAAVLAVVGIVVAKRRKPSRRGKGWKTGAGAVVSSSYTSTGTTGSSASTAYRSSTGTTGSESDEAGPAGGRQGRNGRRGGGRQLISSGSRTSRRNAGSNTAPSSTTSSGADRSSSGSSSGDNSSMYSKMDVLADDPAMFYQYTSGATADAIDTFHNDNDFSWNRHPAWRSESRERGSRSAADGAVPEIAYAGGGVLQESSDDFAMLPTPSTEDFEGGILDRGYNGGAGAGLDRHPYDNDDLGQYNGRLRHGNGWA